MTGMMEKVPERIPSQDRHGPRAGLEPTGDAAGDGYPGFNYNLNRIGALEHHGYAPPDYLTDVLANIGTGFVQRNRAGHPFFLELATFAPHEPYTPAPRRREHLPRPARAAAAFGARRDTAAPRALEPTSPLTNARDREYGSQVS